MFPDLETRVLPSALGFLGQALCWGPLGPLCPILFSSPIYPEMHLVPHFFDSS